MPDTPVGDGLDETETPVGDKVTRPTRLSAPRRLSAGRVPARNPVPGRLAPNAVGHVVGDVPGRTADTADRVRHAPGRADTDNDRPTHDTEVRPFAPDRPPNTGDVPGVLAVAVLLDLAHRGPHGVRPRRPRPSKIPSLAPSLAEDLQRRHAQVVGHLLRLSDAVAVVTRLGPAIGVDTEPSKAPTDPPAGRQTRPTSAAETGPPSDGRPNEEPSPGRDPVGRHVDRDGIRLADTDHLGRTGGTRPVDTGRGVAGEGTKTVDDPVGPSVVMAVLAVHPLAGGLPRQVARPSTRPVRRVVAAPRPTRQGVTRPRRPSVVEGPVLPRRQAQAAAPVAHGRGVGAVLVAPDGAVGTVVLRLADHPALA